MQAPASAGCADWLRRAAGAALPVVGSPIFAAPATAVLARVPTLAPGLSSAQEQPWKFSIAPACLRPDRLTAKGPQYRWATGTRLRKSGPDIPSAPAMRLDDSSLASTGRTRYGTAALFTTRTTGSSHLCRRNSVRPMSLSREFMSSCRCSERPRPCSGSRG